MALDNLNPTSAKGVFYRTEPGRKNGVKLDRQFVIVYKLSGKKYRGVIGWESERGVDGRPLHSIARCQDKIEEFKRNHKTGSGPVCLEDERIRTQRSLQEQQAAEKARQEALSNRPTINRLWQLYVEANPGMKGIVADRNRFDNYLRADFGGKTPDQITPLDLDRLRLAMLRGKIGPKKMVKDRSGRAVETQSPKSPQTIKHVLVLLRRIIRFAVQRRLCPQPDLTFKMPKVDNQVTEHLTDEQLARLLNALDKETDSLVVGVVKLALLTGMRKGELLSLRWQNVDLDRQLVKIANPKGGVSASIPLSDDAANVLRNLPHTHDLVFPGSGGKIRTDMKRPLDRIRKAAGLPAGFRPLHGLRHHYASSLACSGEVDIYRLQRMLLHKDPKTTQRYAHLSDTALRDAANVAARALNSIHQADQKENCVIDEQDVAG